jgi:hypothetical protein
MGLHGLSQEMVTFIKKQKALKLTPEVRLTKGEESTSE